MKKKISVLALASIFAAGSAMASGWRIPEQSVDSTAKAGANIASSSRADSAYYNPANMSWMEDTWHVEADMSYIYLSEIDYEDGRVATGGLADGHSEEEHFLVPTGFVVSPLYGIARFGFAMVAPYGLSKQWKGSYAKSFAEEFSLQVIEVNPTVSFKLGNMASFAAGPRFLYAKAKVTSSSYDSPIVSLPSPPYPAGSDFSRDMDGNTTEWGWNVAFAIKPIEPLNISVTYRSHIDLDFSDTADLTYEPFVPVSTSFDANVIVPAPAVLAASLAYDILDNLTVELTWDRTYWSKYESLDFNFSPVDPFNPFDVPQTRNWTDTDAYRISVTYGVTDALTLMAGFGYDENPAPTENVGFEIPDSDAWLYSLGVQYKINDNLEIGLAALYDYKESRTVEVSPTDTVYGEFTNASAFLVTAGLSYKF